MTFEKLFMNAIENCEQNEYDSSGRNDAIDRLCKSLRRELKPLVDESEFTGLWVHVPYGQKSANIELMAHGGYIFIPIICKLKVSKKEIKWGERCTFYDPVYAGLEDDSLMNTDVVEYLNHLYKTNETIQTAKRKEQYEDKVLKDNKELIENFNGLIDKINLLSSEDRAIVRGKLSYICYF